MKKLFFLTALISATLFISACAQTPVANEEPSSIIEETSTEEMTTQTEEETPDSVQTPKFDTLDEYISLILASETKDAYVASEPDGYARTNFGGIDLDVTPDGVSATVYVLEPSEGISDLEENVTFYLEIIEPAPCWTEENCDEPETVEYFGPFQGELGRMVQ
ncbi:hypothetical protein ACFL21_05235 [Patescibacteria group bacterium]